MKRKASGMTQCGNTKTDCRWFHWWKTFVKTESIKRQVCRWCGAKRNTFYEPAQPTWEGDDRPILSNFSEGG